MNSERLYYKDAYLRRFHANVIDRADGGRRIYLDQTAFYPNSGGQPADFGTLAGNRVTDVIDEDDRIAHLLDSPLTADAADGEIDWPRRYDHMQQHTGQHLLSAVFIELYNFPTLSFHLGSEVSTIELGAKELEETQIDAVEERTNAIVAEARPVFIHFEDAQSVEGLRKASSRTGVLRVIEIEGLDRSACGGTHVRSTAELGPVQIRKIEKIRGNVRVEFVCGTRARKRGKQDFRIVSELARHAATTIDNLPEHFVSIRQRLTEAEKERQRLALELARRDGEALYRQTAPQVDGMRRAFLEVPALDDSLRARAQSFTGEGRAIFLAASANPAGVLIACSADAGVNAGAVLKDLTGKFGGRGGGSAQLAQGTLSGEAALSAALSALGFENGPA